MADFGGFEVKTPQEVLAQLGAQRQTIAQIRDPQARRVASAQFAIANLFGNAELNKARKVEAGMQAATDELNKEVEAGNLQRGSLDFESERLSAMFSAVKDLDPAAASQIAHQMTVLDEERFERNRLREQSARAERTVRLQESDSANRKNKALRENALENVQYIEWLSDDFDAPPRLKAYNPFDSNSRAEFERDKLTPGAVVRSREEVSADLARDADKGLWNRSDNGKKRVGYEAYNQFLDRANRLTNLFAKNKFAPTSVDEIINLTNNFASEGLAAMTRVAQSMDLTLDEQGTIAKIKQKLLQEFGEEARDSSTVVAATLNMAYTLARSLDSGGRLSDQDVAMAVKMLGGGNADPRTIVRVMLEQAARQGPIMMELDRISFSGRDGASRVIRELIDSTDTRQNNFLKSVGQLIPQEEIEEVMFPDRFRDRRLREAQGVSDEPQAGDETVDVGF